MVLQMPKSGGGGGGAGKKQKGKHQRTLQPRDRPDKKGHSHTSPIDGCKDKGKKGNWETLLDRSSLVSRGGKRGFGKMAAMGETKPTSGRRGTTKGKDDPSKKSK